MGVSTAEATAEHNLPTLDPPALVGIPESDQFRLYPVSCYEIQNIVVKDALPCILPILTQIVNFSLLTSVFPAAWKKSRVIPFVKEGDHEIPNNNHPVSLLVATSKICECVVLNQLTEYMTYMINRKKFTKHQSGNRKFIYLSQIQLLSLQIIR